MAAGSTYTPIATTTLGSSQASYTFTSIPNTFTDLVLVCALATDNPSSINLNVGNGSVDTGTNFSWTYLYGNGSSASSSRGSSDSRIFAMATSTGGSQSTLIVHLQNYANTSTYKTTISRGNETSWGTIATVGLWRNTAAINQIRILANGNNLNAGTTLTLYGIQAA